MASASFFISQSSFAGYKVDEDAIDAMISGAEDVSIQAAMESSTLLSTGKMSGDKTVGGFLLRAYFCGGFALHRYYMGTGGAQLFWYYFCIPVVGGGTACIDFWYVLFTGKDGLSKYADNSSFWVWN